MKHVLYVSWCVVFGVCTHLLWWTTAQAAVMPSSATVSELNAMVAVVNTHVITLTELRNALQIKRILRKDRPAAGLDMTFVVPAVLQDMVTETLQKQAATIHHISISDTQLQQTLHNIAARNRLPSVEALKRKMRQEGLDDRAVIEDIKTQLLLARLREFVMQTSLYIPRSDILAYITTQKTVHPIRYLVDQIFIPIDPNTASEEEQRAVRTRVQAIYDALLHHKKPFSTIKKENAVAASPAQWLIGEAVPEGLRTILQHMTLHHFSPPLQLADGYHILFLQQQKEIPNPFGDIQQWHTIALSIPVQYPHAQTILQQVYREGPRTITDFVPQMVGDRTPHPYHLTDLGWLCAYNVPDHSVLSVLQTQPLPNTMSRPFLSSLGWTILAVLETRKAPLSQSQHILIAQKMLQQAQFDATYRRFLQRLRDQAYIHIYRYAPSGTPK